MFVNKFIPASIPIHPGFVRLIRAPALLCDLAEGHGVKYIAHVLGGALLDITIDSANQPPLNFFPHRQAGPLSASAVCIGCHAVSILGVYCIYLSAGAVLQPRKGMRSNKGTTRDLDAVDTDHCKGVALYTDPTCA